MLKYNQIFSSSTYILHIMFLSVCQAVWMHPNKFTISVWMIRLPFPQVLLSHLQLLLIAWKGELILSILGETYYVNVSLHLLFVHALTNLAICCHFKKEWIQQHRNNSLPFPLISLLLWLVVPYIWFLSKGMLKMALEKYPCHFTSYISSSLAL